MSDGDKAGTPDGAGDLTRESPAPGLAVWQPRRGYRFGVEVYALAGFALAGGHARTAIDLGCGSGVIGLLLAWRGVSMRAVERDPRWVALARRNVAESGVSLPVEEADVRDWFGAPADLVVCNPPWFPPNEPTSPDPWKASSRAMIHGNVADFVACGLRHAPRVCVVTRREREAGLPGHVARRATLGRGVVLLDIREGQGNTTDEVLDLPSIYAAFGR